MRHLDRDLRLLSLANFLYATGLGLYMQLLFVYALQLGASRFAIGALNALMLATIMVVSLPGAWAATRFRLKPVLVAVWWLLVPLSSSSSWRRPGSGSSPGLILFGLRSPTTPPSSPTSTSSPSPRASAPT